MEGYQFAHVEVYSAKGAPGRGLDEYAKRRNGDRAWSAKEVIDEAERVSGACPHVPAYGLAPQILPAAVGSFSDLRQAHAKASVIKSTHERMSKNGKTQKIARKLRSDAASLYSCVVSLPVRTEDALNDPAVRADCMSVISAAMKEEERRIRAAGGTLMMGVIHWDEEHVHVHFLALDLTRGRVDHLHPGRAAKAEYIARNERSVASKKRLNSEGNRAYCDALRDWQDNYHATVFHGAGLLRYGPKRTRMSRAEYKRAKSAAAARSEDIERRNQLRKDRHELIRAQKTFASIAEMDAENMRSWEVNVETQRVANEERAADLSADQSALEEREKTLAERERATAGREATVTRREAAADSSEALIEAATEGFVRIEKSGDKGRIFETKVAKLDPRWPSLQKRIKAALPAAQQVAARLAGHFDKLKQSAADAGREEARRIAKLKLKESRDRLASALPVARRIAAIAKLFSAKMRDQDAGEMMRQVEAVLRVASADKVASERLESAADSENSKPRKAPSSGVDPR